MVLVVLLRLVVDAAGQLLSRPLSRVKSITDMTDARTRTRDQLRVRRTTILNEVLYKQNKRGSFIIKRIMSLS